MELHKWAEMDKWIENNKYKVWRYWQRRIPGDWTPYELENKFMDEMTFVNDTCQMGFIVDYIPEPVKMLGFANAPKYFTTVDYVPIDRLELSFRIDDQLDEKGMELFLEEAKRYKDEISTSEKKRKFRILFINWFN